MTDGKALMKAIIESPDDDAPRLIYADWLDEQGTPDEAERIRLQCALFHESTTDERRKALADRLGKLGSWRAPNLRGIRWPGGSYRGYPNQVRAERWVDLRAAWNVIFSTAPVTWVAVSGLTLGDLDHFLSLPETKILQYVFLGFAVPLDRAVERLAVDAATDGWFVLELSADPQHHLTDHGAEVLTNARHLRGLGSLYARLDDVSPDRRHALLRRLEGSRG
ncbi:MAG TPA: TIGR02996 domain-containing protein [Gemmataceae bacterium]|nr:TIGR02996 domain-containing protein [Gemmataceae bacterium]